MKVLWITNILLPEAKEKLTGKEANGSGGWLSAMSADLTDKGNVDLSVVSASNLVKSLTIVKGKETVYYILPIAEMHRYDSYIPEMQIVADMVKPDLVHIHGTEMPFGLVYMKANGTKRVVVSMQGVVCEIANHYTDGLSKWQILKNVTFRDLSLKTIFGEKKDYCRRSLLEQELLSSVKHVIGRTFFDFNKVKEANPRIVYHKCNESLRDSFYSGRWLYNNCVKHRIFISQSNYPIKGLHILLAALPEVLAKYPDTSLRIAGYDITKHKTLSEIKKYTGYGSIIFSLLKKHELTSHVLFTGILSADEMKNELLDANLFICPSVNENSSNSLGEAQMLGVPCVASRVGGTPEMIPDENCGVLYNCLDAHELSTKILEAFDTSVEFNNEHMCMVAHQRHNRIKNFETLLQIYNLITNEE